MIYQSDEVHGSFDPDLLCIELWIRKKPHFNVVYGLNQIGEEVSLKEVVEGAIERHYDDCDETIEELEATAKQFEKAAARFRSHARTLQREWKAIKDRACG